MHRVKQILKRLRRPSVLFSITSQMITVLVLLKIDVDTTMISGIVTAILSIFVLLGIISDPTTQKNGYSDDWAVCPGCKNLTRHVVANGKRICAECGTLLEPSE